jgi:CheY-like chemotaxis protein
VKAKQPDLFLKATPLTKHSSVGLYILVVEDDPDMAESSALLLRCFGHRVQVVSDGRSACQAVLNKPPPDVVLLELALPDLDGWEVAKRLQEPSREKRLFIIALAYDDASEEDHRRSRQAGIDLHLVKPVAPDFLRQILEKFRRIIMPSKGLSEN